MILVSATINYKNKFNKDYTYYSILIYRSSRYVISLNNWENPKYFTTSFSTLFPFGIKGHIFTIHGQKKEKIFLNAWSKWVLLHYLRR